MTNEERGRGWFEKLESVYNADPSKYTKDDGPLMHEWEPYFYTAIGEILNERDIFQKQSAVKWLDGKFAESRVLTKMRENRDEWIARYEVQQDEIYVLVLERDILRRALLEGHLIERGGGEGHPNVPIQFVVVSPAEVIQRFYDTPELALEALVERLRKEADRES